MKRVNEEVAGALVRLDNDRDFQVVKAWLETSFKDQLIENINLRGEESTRGQGYAEALRDIMAVVDEPRKLADKFKK